MNTAWEDKWLTKPLRVLHRCMMDFAKSSQKLNWELPSLSTNSLA